MVYISVPKQSYIRRESAQKYPGAEIFFAQNIPVVILLKEYRNCNSDAPAGSPDVFKKFFECYDEESYEETYEDMVTDDDIAETLAEFDREAQDERRQKELRSVMMRSNGGNVLRK